MGHRYLGKPIRRLGDGRLLSGRGEFLDDINLPDMLHMSFVRSPHAHAHVRSISKEAGASVPGIESIFTGQDLLKLCRPIRVECALPNYHETERKVIAIDTARFVGEPVAVVVAENRYLAEDAADAIEVTYDALPSVTDVEEALETDAPLVHETIGTNLLFRSEASYGDVDNAFSSAALILEETFRSSRVAGVPLEPRGCVAQYDANRQHLTIWSSTQIPHIVRTALAELLRFPEERIRVVAPDVGGGFGTKAHVYPEELIVGALSIHLRRPIKWMQDRREDLLTSIHARDHLYQIKVGVNYHGEILGVEVRLLTNAGAYPSYPFGCTLEPTGGTRPLPGPYKFRNYRYEACGVATHTCPSGAYRGVAQVTARFTIEGMMDRIGRALAIDPAEIRFRNLIQPTEFPYVNVVGTRYDTGSYSESLHRALEISDYDDYRNNQTPGRLEGGKYRGVGISCFTELTGIGPAGWSPRGVRHVPGFDSAQIRVEPTGGITAVVSAADQGQGHATTFAQIVADELGVGLDTVRLVEGDTGAGLYGSGTFASRSAIASGGALMSASSKLREKMMRLASELLEVPVGDIVLSNGHATVRGAPTKKVRTRDLAEFAYSLTPRPLPPDEEYGLEATSYYGPPAATMANGAHVAQVAIDRETGFVEIERYVVVHDCGRIINPIIVDGQIHGGTAQGLGEVLLEAINYGGEGQLLSESLMDYLIPTAVDVPRMETAHLETPSVDTLGGFKGVGEGGVIGSVPALANAIGDALSGIGASVRFLPLGPGYVRSLIEDALSQRNED